LGFINYVPCYRNIWGSGGIAPPFLTLIIDGGEWSASCSCHITTSETVPDTHCIGGWVGPRARRDIVEKKTLLPFPGINISNTVYHFSPYSVERNKITRTLHPPNIEAAKFPLTFCSGSIKPLCRETCSMFRPSTKA
jgi:hypothetical protein